MELFEAKDNFIIQQDDHSLWCSRLDGSLVAKKGDDLCHAWNPVCLGKVYGVIGKIKLHPDSDWRLILIRGRNALGELYGGHQVYRITRISLLKLSLESPNDLDLELCQKHHFGIHKRERITNSASQKALQKTWDSVKTVAGNVKPRRKDGKDKDKFEKRITEELTKMFNELESYYYTPTGDLTNCIQRQLSSDYDDSQPLWKRVDTRFFWNRHMMLDLIEANNAKADLWIVPIIQGYVHIDVCKIGGEEGPGGSILEMAALRHPTKFNFMVISRRCRYRAGTRYKRRGVDSEGHVANYVETEQIIEFAPHVVSFVQTRGSVPVYWTQTGIKYRPPPRLIKDEEETHKAFVKHFEDEVKVYKTVSIVSLTEQAGREKVISDTFLKHVLKYNSDKITYITFDFHEYCRGMRFENVSILTDNIEDIVKQLRYCWADSNGIICEQKGVFRVNCMDCLDRTNVVQTTLARIIMETLCRKLGLLMPEEHLPISCRQTFQRAWANNGDALSRQYAGTVALKGDYTRTGERKFTGMMKDGMHSANRYIRNTFRDAYRQATIDLMLGNPITEDLRLLNSKTQTDEIDGNEEVAEKEENIQQLIQYCMQTLLENPDSCLGGWALIDCDPRTGDIDQQDADLIMLLSQDTYYVARYDDDVENITEYQAIPLSSLYKIEIGPEPAVFKSKYQCIRLSYHYCNDDLFHTMRLPSTRLFNNIIISINNSEESQESLRAIAQSFSAAAKEQNVTVLEEKLVRRKSKLANNVKQFDSNTLTMWSQNNISGQIDVAPAKPDSDGKSLGDPLPPSSQSKITILGSNVKKTLGNLNPVKKMSRLTNILTKSKPKVKLSGVLYNSSVSSSRSSSDSEDEVIDYNVTIEKAPSRDSDVVFASNDILMKFDAVSKLDGDQNTNQHPKSITVRQKPKGLRHMSDRSHENDYSFDDSDDAAKLSHTNSLDHDEVVLQSCGILATSTNNYVLHTVKSSEEFAVINTRKTENKKDDDLDSGKVTRPVFSTSFSSSGSSENGKPNENLGHNLQGAHHENGALVAKSHSDNENDDPVHKQHPKLSALNHPHMKISFSEGSILTPDINQPQTDSSTFSRIRAKVSNAINIPSPKLLRSKQTAVNLSLNNRVKSQLKYKECKTKIIQL